MRRISDVLTDVMADPTLSEDAREALEDGVHRPHRHCPCVDCMRAYLASVGDAAISEHRPPTPTGAK